MKTILVTGGCGFIGSNFVLKLLGEEDVRVVNLDVLTYAGNLENLKTLEGNPRYSFVRGDIGDLELVQKLIEDMDVTLVAHFAAESHVDRSIEDPATFVRTNVMGTFGMLEAARRAWLKMGGGAYPEGARFLHVSTDEVYGSLGETGYFTETTPYDPKSPYSASKAASDHLARAYEHTYGLPVLVTNCSNNYGPYQFPEKLIPLIICNALEGKPLPVYGDGGNVRDWLYVGDHCEALWTVIKTGKIGETYNIGGNCERKNLEVVHTLCDLLDELAPALPGGEPRRSLIKFVKDRPGHDRRYAIDASKIKDELGWAPSVDFTEGMRRTVSWYLTNQDWVTGVRDGSYKEYYKKMYEGR